MLSNRRELSIISLFPRKIGITMITSHMITKIRDIIATGKFILLFTLFPLYQKLCVRTFY
jgi:hypothetical protein